MSYDLFFAFKQPISRATVEDYFRRRPHYELNGSAVYQNPHTGVYFVFEFQADEADQNQLVGAALNVNYFRPHVFGLEAEPEVRAFVDEFQPAVEDPRMNGMGQGPYSTEAFFTGWNSGNAFAYESIAPQTSEPHFALPEAKIEAIWRWNREKAAVQERLGESMFVPTILLANIDGQLQSAIVWGDGTPTLMPPTDVVIVVRDQLAPKRLFRAPVKDHCIVRPDQLTEVLGPFVDRGRAMEVGVPEYLEPTSQLTNFVGKLRQFAGRLDIVSVDRVLSQELLASIRPD